MATGTTASWKPAAPRAATWALAVGLILGGILSPTPFRSRCDFLPGPGLCCAQETSRDATPVLGPAATLTAAGVVLDMVCRQDRLVVATDVGIIEIFALPGGDSAGGRRPGGDRTAGEPVAGGKTAVVSLPGITDFFGDQMPPRIFSVDRSPDQGVLLFVAEEKGGARSLRLAVVGAREPADVAGEQYLVFSAAAGLFIKKARFVADDLALVALMSNELLLVTLSSGETRYRVQVSQSSFSDFALDENRSLAAVADESGAVTLLEVASGQVRRVLRDGNLDNVYKVGFCGGRVITAGQDRCTAVYDTATGACRRLASDFLVYAAGLSPSGSRGAYGAGEQNDIAVFDTDSGVVSHLLRGARSTLNTIIFRNERHLVSASDDTRILLWSVP